MAGETTENARKRCLACHGVGWHQIVEELDPSGWTACLACGQTGWADAVGEPIPRPKPPNETA